MTIDNILQEIFEFDDPVIDKSREKKIRDFITRITDGYALNKYLAVNINESIIVYILTNRYIIKIEITNKTIQSSTCSLIDIESMKIKRDYEEENEEAKIVFRGNESIGLSYPIDDNKVIDFFDAVNRQRK